MKSVLKTYAIVFWNGQRHQVTQVHLELLFEITIFEGCDAFIRLQKNMNLEKLKLFHQLLLTNIIFSDC